MIVPCHAQVAIRDELRRSKGDVPSAMSLKAYVSCGDEMCLFEIGFTPISM
jgi:hypothetical protein